MDSSHQLTQKIKARLRESIDSTPDRVGRFFKKNNNEYAAFDKFLGITVPKLREIAKQYRSTSLQTIYLLLTSVFNEERMFALILLVWQYQNADCQQKKNIYQFYVKNIQYINNWNLVDQSAHYILGDYLWDKERHILLRMARSDSLWLRRISIVATWYFIKKGDFQWTLDLAKILMDDKEDLIHKACGWMLREIDKRNREIFIDFLSVYCTFMPRTMLRYAIEKFPKKMRQEYLLRK